MKRLLNNRSLLSALLAAACTAAAALGATFTWTGGAGDDFWTTKTNWDAMGMPTCDYPCTAGDDVLIPVEPGGAVWGDIDLDFFDPFALTIDDMTILDGVDFDSDHHPHEMTAETLTIDASDDDITVTFRRVFELIAN